MGHSTEQVQTVVPQPKKKNTRNTKMNLSPRVKCKLAAQNRSLELLQTTAR